MHIDDLLKALIDHGGSDLHILPGLPPAIRVRGELAPIPNAPQLFPEQLEHMVYAILDAEQRRQFETDPHNRYELDFAYSIEGVGRFRFNVHKQRGTVGAVARALATSIPKLESLGMPPAVQKFATTRKGLALVTGPTGSGKSTTLAALIDSINASRADHIITIEDPIEYIHNSKKAYVMQREIGETADSLSFRNALKSALRQDPDVILIGEMRDYETIGIAITSAETGHLVFGTLHTSSAAQTVSRVIDVFPTDQHEQVKTQLAGNIFGVVSQLLMPTADGKGRAAAQEIMFANAAIKNNIRAANLDAIYQSIQTGIKEGMQTMDMSLAALVKSGRVALETIAPYLRDESTRRSLGIATKDANGGGQPSGGLGAAGASVGVSGNGGNGNGGNGHTMAAQPAAASEPAEQPKRRGLGMMIPPWEKNG